MSTIVLKYLVILGIVNDKILDINRISTIEDIYRIIPKHVKFVLDIFAKTRLFIVHVVVVTTYPDGLRKTLLDTTH